MAYKIFLTIIVFSVMILLAVLGSFEIEMPDRPEIPIHVRLADKVMKNYADQMYEQKDLLIFGVGGGMMTKIMMILKL